MPTLSFIVLISALLATASAQSSGPSVWASVAMIMHGARQLHAQGAAFRSRYLSGITPTNNSEGQITSRAAIKGIARNVVEHEQLSVLSVTDTHIVAGATAFMQGLYPPITQAFAADKGGSNISYSTTGRNYTQYPLSGYQYPAIRTLGMLDPESIDLRGNTECPQWQISTQQDFMNDPAMLELYNSTLPKYQSLFSTPPLNDGDVSLANANFWDAYNIWDYIRYRYSHEKPIYEGLMYTFGKDGQFLKMYARNQQVFMNSLQTPSGRKKGDMIRTIAGQTFARKVVDALKANGNYGGYSHKMTLMFSSQEPFMSFFSLAQLQTEDLPLISPFWNIPEPGAAMIFELIGDEPNQPDTYPTEKNLYVRFLYRKDSNPDTPFEEYPLFGRTSPETRVPYSFFKQEMLKFGIETNEWCGICSSSQAFCRGLVSEAPRNAAEAIRAAVRKPYVAGIIGGAIVLVAVGLLFAGLAVLGGFRIRRAQKGGAGGDNKDIGRAAVLGGFKAAEKKPSDPDVAVSRRGVPHERQGSWELREGRDVNDQMGGIAHKNSTASFQSTTMDDDDVSSVSGATPMKPLESV